MSKAILLLVALGLSAFAEGAYGLKCDPSQIKPEEASCASFVPLNGSVFRMRQPDGQTRLFVRDAATPEFLRGEPPWVAEQDGSRTLVMTDPEFKGGQTGFMFLNGFLRGVLADGREYRIPPAPAAKSPDGIAQLWPAAESRLVAAATPDIWKDGSRLRLWFDNPNKAGLLFAELALAALALVFLRPVALRLLGALLSLAAFAGLALTSSRGAFLSFVCGLLVLALTRAKALLTWRRIAVLAAAGCVVVGCLLVSGQGDRFGRNLFREGARETSRLTVWAAVPRMMVDAPGGWGFGNSARAYIDWYQEKSDCLLKNLISGHLTFLVEAGWTLRCAYLFGWAFLLFLSLARALKGGSPVPAAVLAAFAVAACFNPVLTVPELLAIPLAAVGIVLARPRADGARLWRTGAALAAGATALVLVGVFVAAAFLQDGVRVRRSGDAVCLNGARPDVWLVDDDYVLHGGYWWLFGRELRAWFSANPRARAVGRAASLADLPREMDVLVLAGEACRGYIGLANRPKAAHTVFLSPSFGWDEVPSDVLAASDVRLVAGTLAARLQPAPAERPEWVRLVPGAELYIPEWTAYLK